MLLKVNICYQGYLFCAVRTNWGSSPIGTTFNFWRRARDSNPRSRVCDLHDFQSCSFGQLGQLSICVALILYIIIQKKSSLCDKNLQLFHPVSLLLRTTPAVDAITALTISVGISVSRGAAAVRLPPLCRSINIIPNKYCIGIPTATVTRI